MKLVADVSASPACAGTEGAVMHAPPLPALGELQLIQSKADIEAPPVELSGLVACSVSYV